MTIDASIPLQGNAPPDPLAAAAKIYTIKAAMQQAQLGDYELKDQLTLRNAASDPRTKNPDGSTNIQSLLSLTTGQVSPKTTLTLQAASQKQEEQKMQMMEQKQKMGEKLRDDMGAFATSLIPQIEEAEKKVGLKGAIDLYADQIKAEHEKMLPILTQLGHQPPEKTEERDPEKVMAALKQARNAYPKYAESQLKASQPETPHEARMAGAAEKRANAAADSSDQTIPPETLKFMAKQALTGDQSVMQNIGRGKQGGKNIAAFREALKKEAADQGISPEELAARNAEFFGTKAGERALGTRTAQVGMAVSEAKRMIPLALTASEEVSRTGIKSFNEVEQAIQRGTASPALRKFVAANNSLVNVYSRAVSPTGTPTVSDKDHAREVLSTAFSKGDYKAAVDQLQAEMEAAQASPGDVRKEFRSAVTGKEDKPKSDKPRLPLSEIFGTGDAVPR